MELMSRVMIDDLAIQQIYIFLILHLFLRMKYLLQVIISTQLFVRVIIDHIQIILLDLTVMSYLVQEVQCKWKFTEVYLVLSCPAQDGMNHVALCFLVLLHLIDLLLFCLLLEVLL